MLCPSLSPFGERNNKPGGRLAPGFLFGDKRPVRGGVPHMSLAISGRPGVAAETVGLPRVSRRLLPQCAHSVANPAKKGKGRRVGLRRPGEQRTENGERSARQARDGRGRVTKWRSRRPSGLIGPIGPTALSNQPILLISQSAGAPMARPGRHQTFWAGTPKTVAEGWRLERRTAPAPRVHWSPTRLPGMTWAPVWRVTPSPRTA